MLVVFGHSRAPAHACNYQKHLVLLFGSIRASAPPVIRKEPALTALACGLTIAQGSDTIASEAVHSAGGVTDKTRSTILIRRQIRLATHHSATTSDETLSELDALDWEALVRL